VYLRNIKSDLPITTEPVSVKALEATTSLLILVPYFKAHNSWAGDIFLKTDLRQITTLVHKLPANCLEKSVVNPIPCNECAKNMTASLDKWVMQMKTKCFLMC
jgi:hypothetical protein